MDSCRRGNDKKVSASATPLCRPRIFRRLSICLRLWIPAFAGMTEGASCRPQPGVYLSGLSLPDACPSRPVGSRQRNARSKRQKRRASACLLILILGRIRGRHHHGAAGARRLWPDDAPASSVLGRGADAFAHRPFCHALIAVRETKKGASRSALSSCESQPALTPNNTSQIRPDAACARSEPLPAFSARYSCR